VKSSFRAFVRAVALVALILAPSCSTEIGRDRAPEYFAQHRDHFQHLIEQVQACQPETGRIDRLEYIRCSSPADSASGVFDAMQRVKARWIRPNYSEADDGTRSLAGVDVTIHATGVSFAGVVEQFRYQVDPDSSATYERKEIGEAVIERLPLTDAPHHWFWWKVDR